MQRVAGAIGFSISPATWAAALVVVAGWITGALFIAQHIASTPQDLTQRQALVAPQPEPEPSQISNGAAKAAREPVKQVRLAPDPSMPAAPRQASRNEAAKDATLPRASHDKAARAGGETGRASWYDIAASTASGEAMDGAALTAAHPSLPFGSKVRVANLANGRSVVVRINDRGPYSKGRIIDVSRAAAEQLGMLRAGVARVSVTPVADAAASKTAAPGEVASDAVAGDAVASARDGASPLQR
ncbi:MAG: septal ring lytic transglycosylase RlpA family protein [Methyloceanibacter sp.]